MEALQITIAPQGDGWVVVHPEPSDVVYLTKEAALQGAVAAIEGAMAMGQPVVLTIPGGEGRFD